MPGRPETTDLPLVLVAIRLSVEAIKSAGYSSIQPSQQPEGWRRPDKGEKWGVLCAEATFEEVLYLHFSLPLVLQLTGKRLPSAFTHFCPNYL